MTLEAWQVELRRQFGREQKFKLKNAGPEPLFSEYEVANPQSGRTYRVAIRGSALGENFCSCPDYAVNTLGTCKHIEFALDRLGRKPGAKAALALGYQPAYSEVYLQYGARREIVFKPGTDCPEELKNLARGYFDEDNRLKTEAFDRFPRFLQKALAGEHEFRCYPDALNFIAQVRDQAMLAEKVREMFPQGIRSAAFKHLLKTTMYPYQREGALFAASAGRCLNADDMGLGKTIQAIAAAEILARTAGVEKVLVVAPTSLKHQWRGEIEKFAGREATVVEGMLSRRRELYRAESFYKITNYDVIHRDRDAIAEWQPDLIVLDEAQRIKNWQTRTAQSVKMLDSKYAIVLTGTPLENRLEELHSIVQFVDRFRLGPMFRFLNEHQHVDDHGRVVGYKSLDRITETLKPILVRRTKDKVLKELPERLEKRFFVPMTEPQAKHHEENRETVARTVQKWRRYGFLSEADQLRLRIALQNMRMSCNSTYLLDHQTDHGVKADELIALLGEIFEEPQHKVVIFSQWTRMHETVQWRLEKKKWEHVLFHGGVPGPKRKDLIHQFKEDPKCRLFLSTDAGGVGLNLQHASAVVNLDLPWNPAVLEQRIGRVHRLGQHRPVRVVNFIAQGTIEEAMLGVLAFKKSMFAGVLDGGESEVFLGGTKLKKFMESVEQATGAIPAAMPREEEPPATERSNGQSQKSSAGQDAPLDLEVLAAEEKPSAPQNAWADVFSAGLALLEKFQNAVSPEKPGQPAARAPSSLPAGMIATEESTGQPYLKLPLPEPQVLQKIFEFVKSLRGN
ncbi:MAG: DEAD/DEAH box helicase [Pirellulales bacterium]|nr:DEAD/DEAH box helicase [Pirellulales bacterium]